jgi:predicted transcriptional regulator
MKPTATTTPAPPRVFRYDPRESGTRRWLGELEDVLMDILWTEARAMTTDGVARRVERSYTTVATTLNRLTDKGMLTRTLGYGRGTGAYLYQARETCAAFQARQIAAIEESL